MSTTTTNASFAGRSLGQRIWDGMVAMGERRAKAEILRHFEMLSDESLAEHGLSRAELRARIERGTLWERL